MNSHPPVTEQKVVVSAQPTTSHLPSLEVMGSVAGAFLAIAGLVTLIYNFLMREVKRDISDVVTKVEQINHSHKNLKTEVSALEHFRAIDVERIVKLETNLGNLEKGMDRIEKRLDTMAEASNEARKEIIDSLREMRTSTIKTP